MSLHLTPSEIKLADELITGLEKGSRFQKWGRWVNLFWGVVMLGFAIFLYFFIRWFYDQTFVRDLFGFILDKKTFDPESFRMYVNIKMVSVFMLVMFNLQMAFFGILGFTLTFVNLVNWNRHRRDALIAKVLRSEFERERRFSGIL